MSANPEISPTDIAPERRTLNLSLRNDCHTSRRVLSEKSGGGVRSSSQNPYFIYDQNLRYSPPYLWPGQKFETLFMT